MARDLSLSRTGSVCSVRESCRWQDVARVLLAAGADPNAALEEALGDRTTARWPALVLLVHFYDRADCVRHYFFCSLDLPTFSLRYR